MDSSTSAAQLQPIAHLQPLAQFALELHQLVTDLQDRRAAAQAMPSLRERSQGMAKRAKEAAAQWSASHPGMSDLLERTSQRLQNLDFGRGWGSRAQRQAAFKIAQYYEGIARQLRANPAITVALPELRPKNYTRNLFHIGNGVMAAALYTAIDDRMVMLTIAAAYLVVMASMEITRRFSDRVNQLLVDKVFASIARPSEAWRINSATWFGFAIVLMLAAGFPRLSCVAAVLTLGIGDPMAALIGKRWGKHKLVGPKSLEGTLAFALSSALLVTAWLSIFMGASLVPGGGTGAVLAAALPIALTAGVAGALAELYSHKLEDNFAIPLAVAAATSLWTL